VLCDQRGGAPRQLDRGDPAELVEAGQYERDRERRRERTHVHVTRQRDADDVAFAEILVVELAVDLGVRPHRHYVADAAGQLDHRGVVLAAVGREVANLANHVLARIEFDPLAVVLVVLRVRVDRFEIVKGWRLLGYGPV